MAKSIRDMVNEANSAVEVMDAEASADLVDTDEAIFVDVREPVELAREGKVPGAVHVPRGVLEFAIADDSPAHNPLFTMDKKIVFYCTNGSRSALAALTAKDMGLKQVVNMAGGFDAYKAIGGDVEEV